MSTNPSTSHPSTKADSVASTYHQSYLPWTQGPKNATDNLTALQKMQVSMKALKSALGSLAPNDKCFESCVTGWLPTAEEYVDKYPRIFGAFSDSSKYE